MTKPARHEIRNDLAYDLGSGVGWAVGSAVVLVARPFMWLALHDWNDQRQWLEKKLRR